MAGGREIRAGRAYVEVSIRDKLTQQLKHVARRFAAFAAMVKATSAQLAGGMRAIAESMGRIGRAVAGVGAGVLAVLGKAVHTFLSLSAEAKKAGISIAGLDPQKAEALQGALDGVKAAFTALLFRGGEALAEPLTALLEVMRAVLLEAARFVKENQAVVMIIAAVAAGAVVAGAVLIGLATAFGLVAAAVVAVSTLITAVSAVVGFLLTPVGAVVAILGVLAVALVAGGVAFLAFTDIGQAAMTGLWKALMKVWEVAKAVFQGITDAALGGRLDLAWQIITQTIVVAWRSAMAMMAEAFAALVSLVTAQMSRLLTTIATALGIAEAGLASLRGSEVNLGSQAVLGLNATLQGGAGAASAFAAGQQQAVSGAAAELAMLLKQAKEAREVKQAADAEKALAAQAPPPAAFSSVGFGVAGTSSAAAAGFLRSSSVQQVEDKKGNEKLDDLKRAVEAIELTSTAEVG